ncbi:restriction endonuclease subunit S [Chroococcidiopsis sp. FACHB-1243]|uniref:restriction endonuclease subunit S n=1 Tax=Chroococcidiopsis sp. [FACHB-1243] TaxID=2692781 RepID=UPI00177FEC6B|nr:restriction endonuclease subunit S [Chroococcidiopsis sp. [FACHB-1243]]MBD2310048.1 restriction endonuclease subunit S [Chroococcidiopsis sp. [FACHB-1243]]
MKIEYYQAYKDSGIEWLGDVPEHWSIRKAKTLCSHIKDGTHGSFERVEIGYPLLSVRNIVNSKFLFLNDDSFISEEDYKKISKSLKIKEGDLQLAIVGATMGKVALVPANMPEFVTQRSLATLRPIIKILTSKFFLYFASCSYFQDTLWSNTSYSAQPGIYLNTLSNIDILVPPLPEQKAIAHYLDTKTAQCDRKIDLLTQKATLYGNLKQSLINETVTRGLDKSVPMKDSGIEWIGEVPEHWSLSRIKNLTKTKSGTTPQSGLSQYYDNGTHFWVRTTDLNNNKLYSSEFKVTDLAREHYNLASIPIRSILLAMYGGMGTIGKNAILQEEVTINQSVCAIFPNNKKFFSEYLWYYIQYFRPHWEIFADSARKDPNINQEAIKRLWVTLPPLPEQKDIAHYLDTKTTQIDQIIQTQKC